MSLDSGRQDLRTVARGGVLNFGALIGNAIAGAVLVLVVTRSGLSAHDVGVFFEAVAFFNIAVSIALWGADVGLVRSIPRLRVLDRYRDVRRTIGVATAAVFVAGVLLAVLVQVFAEPVARVFTREGDPAALARSLRIVSLFLPIAGVYMACVAATRGFGTMRVFALVDKLGLAIAQPVFVGLALALGLGVSAVVLAWIGPTLLAAAVAVVLLARMVARLESRAGAVAQDAVPERRLFVEFWRFAAPRGLAGVFAVTVLWFHTLLLGALRSPEEAGVYSAATRYLMLGQFASLAIVQVVAPKLSELLSAHRRDRAREVYRTGTAWAMTVAWPVFWTMIVFAPVLLSVFGPGYEGAQQALVILGASMLVASGTGPVDTVLLMGGKSSLNLLNTVVAVVCNVTLNLLLIPRLGMTGAAIAWGVSLLANNLLPLGEIWAIFRLHPYGRSVLTVAAASAACFGLIPLVARLAFGESLGVFVAVEAAAVAAYVAVLLGRRHALQLPILWDSLRARHGLGGRASTREPDRAAEPPPAGSRASVGAPVGTEHER